MIKNIDNETNIDELEKLFSQFGFVNKVTFICDKYSGSFKGYS
jgi:RNA recognition motif-containing protein